MYTSVYGQTTEPVSVEEVKEVETPASTTPNTLQNEVISNEKALDIKKIERPRVSGKKEVKPLEKIEPIKIN